MQKATAWSLTLAVAPVVLVAACSGGISTSETEACNQINAWSTGGQEDPERFDEAVAAAQDELSHADDSPLAEPLAKLAGSAESQRAANVESFMGSCADHGWEAPEG